LNKSIANQIVQEMKMKKIRGTPQMQEYLNKKKVSSKDLPLVMSVMLGIDYNQFSYFVFKKIREELASLSESPHFIDFLESLGIKEEEKNSNLLAFLSELPSVNRESSMLVFESIKNSKINSLKISSGLVLGQLHLNSPEKIFDDIKINLSSEDAEKTSLIIAFELIASKNKNMKPPKYVLDFIIECSNSSDKKLSYCATRACIVNLELDRQRFEKAIINYLEKSDDNKIGICDIIHFTDTIDGNFEFVLLKLCAKSESIGVINWITNVIGHKLYRSNIDKVVLMKEALNLLKIWSRNKNFQRLDTAWMLEMIGRTDIDSGIKYLETWVDEGVGDILAQFFFPNIIRELFKNHKNKFVNTMNSWKSKNNFLEVILFSIKELLDDIRLHYRGRLRSYNSKIERLAVLVDSSHSSTLKTTNDINSVGDMILSSLKNIESIHIDDKNPNRINIQTTCNGLIDLKKLVDEDRFLAQASLEILITICIDEGVHFQQLTREFNDARLQSIVSKSLILINAMMKEKRILNYGKAKSNFSLFPKINKFLGSRWLEEKIQSKSEHPLIVRISKFDFSKINEAMQEYTQESVPFKKKDILNKLLSPLGNLIFVRHLEKCLGLFKTRTSRGSSRIVDGLQKEEDFYQTESQLEVAHALKENEFHVELEDESLGRPVDIIATKKNKRLLFEVTSIDTIVGLKYGNYESNIPNKIRSTIHKKLEKQIKHYSSKPDDLIIIVIDISRAGYLDTSDVFHALYGSPAINIIKDDTSEIVKIESTLSNDGIAITNAISGKLSAIVLYSTDISYEENTIKLKGSLIVNMKSKYPVDEYILKDISQALFGHSNIIK
jgi:hypothetical protein